MNFLNRIIYITMIGLLILPVSLSAGNHTSSIKFEITETAVNRALVSQFNDPNFLFQNFSGVVNIPGFGNANYSIDLERPNVIFNTNSVSIELNFDFHATLGANNWDYNFNIEPTIYIPPASLSTDQLEAWLQDLPDKINALSSIPSWLKTLVINLYSGYKPWVYPSKIVESVIDNINDVDFIKQRAMSVTSLSLGTSIQNDKWVITVTTGISSGSTSVSSIL